VILHPANSARLIAVAIASLALAGRAQLPVIVQQPQSVLVGAGGQVSFTVAVSAATPDVRYLWRYNGGNIPGATSPLLSLSNVQFSAAGSYSVTVFNELGAVTSDRADLILSTIPGFPFSDQMSDSTPLLNPLGGRVRGSNAGATAEPGEPPHAGKPPRRSVWARWTAPAFNCVATFRTAGSGFDTVLAIYAGNSVNDLIASASDDDGDDSLNSQVTFQPQPGTQYFIAIDGFGGSSGNFVLGWSLQGTAQSLPWFTLQPFDRAALPGSDVTLAVDTTSTETTWQWFLDGQLLPGATTRLLRLTNVTAADVGTYFCRASLGNLSLDSQRARLQLNSDELGRLNIGAVTTEKLFNARLVANDFKSDRQGPRPKTVARGFSGTQVFTTAGSTKEIGEPNHCGIAGGASEWYAIQAEADGTLCLSTEGSNFDTVLAVYTGPGDQYATLVSTACDNNSGADGQDSRVSFAATANTIYWVAIDGANHPVTGNPARGTVVLNFRLFLPLQLTTLSHPDTAGGKLVLQVTGTPHLPAVVESSLDSEATNWIAQFTNATPTGVFRFTNGNVNTAPAKVYRAVNRL
jgi:hypothetical protein